MFSDSFLTDLFKYKIFSNKQSYYKGVHLMTTGHCKTLFLVTFRHWQGHG